jgi:predicted ribosomally synthesized peptide with SipW-like signal peptide
MNKKILTGVISIILGTLVAVPAYAYFNSISVSASNIFSTGTLKLKLANGDSTFTDNVASTFGGTVAPGTCLPPATLQIKNTGTVPADHIDITATHSDPDVASIMRIKTLTYDNNPVVLSDINNNGIQDLKDFSILNKSFTDFNAHTLLMEVCMDESATNAVQGKTDSMDLSITLDQGKHL